MITEVPTAVPVTTPVAEPTVAPLPAAALQVPDSDESVNSVVEPKHIVASPVMGCGGALTITVVAAAAPHPFE